MIEDINKITTELYREIERNLKVLNDEYRKKICILPTGKYAGRKAVIEAVSHFNGSIQIHAHPLRLDLSAKLADDVCYLPLAYWDNKFEIHGEFDSVKIGSGLDPF